MDFDRSTLEGIVKHFTKKKCPTDDDTCPCKDKEESPEYPGYIEYYELIYNNEVFVFCDISEVPKFINTVHLSEKIKNNLEEEQEIIKQYYNVQKYTGCLSKTPKESYFIILDADEIDDFNNIEIRHNLRSENIHVNVWMDYESNPNLYYNDDCSVSILDENKIMISLTSDFYNRDHPDLLKSVKIVVTTY